MATEQELQEQSRRILAETQRFADMLDQHVELVLGIGQVAYVKMVHPASCPERQEEIKKLAPANPEDLGAEKIDVPDAFKRLFGEGPQS